MDSIRSKRSLVESGLDHGNGSNSTEVQHDPASGSIAPTKKPRLDPTPHDHRPQAIPKFEKSRVKPHKPETPSATKITDDLVAKYRSTSAIKELRCLIMALQDTAWVEEYTARAFHELDCFAGGQGLTAQKIAQHNAGVPTSIRKNACLVRGKPISKVKPYDKTYISLHCSTCNGIQHKWHFHRGYLQAALIGALKDSSGHNVGLMDALLGSTDSSHLCHNSPCSDPFHYVAESDRLNGQRNVCMSAVLARRSQTCLHTPECRVDLTWQLGKDYYKHVTNECIQEAIPLPPACWSCTKGCKSSGRYGFSTTEHWRKQGCRLGGGFVRLHGGAVVLPKYDRYSTSLTFSTTTEDQTTISTFFKKV